MEYPNIKNLDRLAENWQPRWRCSCSKLEVPIKKSPVVVESGESTSAARQVAFKDLITSTEGDN